MPVKIIDNDFYSLHGIWGAGGCLALGRIGKGAGMVVGNVQPPVRALYAGYRAGKGQPVFLPFIPDVKVGLGADAYVAADVAAALPAGSPPPQMFSCFGKGDIARSMGMSGEEWRAGRMTLTVTSFFGAVPDPSRTKHADLRRKMCPAIYAKIAFDNSDGKEPLVGAFGMQGVRRPISDATGGALLGFAHQGDWGFAALPGDDIDEVMDWMVLSAVFDEKPRAVRHLAAEGCLRFRVPAGEKREYVIALGSYRDGVATAGLRTRLFQSTLFRDLEDVLSVALARSAEALGEASALDAELDSAHLSDERKFLIAHAAHSYLASTELLVDDGGTPIFIVNEGEYQMMNTLDLTIDQAFHELCYSPWTVGRELDFFLSRSSYRDEYGLAFAHDQGVADCFTPQGTSSYEMPGLTGCFSFMSYEETLNWILTACLYVRNAKDLSWFARNQAAFVDAVRSILARDGNGDGIMDRDSGRCKGGSEITTFDSLDASLGQARNNLYVAVKAWSSLVCAASIFDDAIDSGRKDGSSVQDFGVVVDSARDAAARIARTVVSKVHEPDGYIPAVFEGGNDSRIIPAVEALVYPALCGVSEAVSFTGPYAALIKALKRHLETVLVSGVCLDPVSGGWKLSSTSRNTWPSKIFISQYVAENILGIRDERTARDAAHVKWQCNASADWAATDQVDSATGKDLGSRLYPRLVSSILWIHSPKA